MSLGTVTSSACEVLVEGAPLSPLVSQYLYSVEVDSSMFVPSQFKLTFKALPNQILEDGGLQLAVEVIVQVSQDGAPIPIITGEITSVEVEGDALGVNTIVKGMDRSHRLMRGNQTMGYQEAMASEVVTELLGQCEVPMGVIVETETMYPVLSQANISAWDLIQQLARLENYVAFSDQLGFFYFGPMPEPEEGDPPALAYETPTSGTQLVVGKNMRHFRAVVTSVEQIPSVTATGYDPTTTEPLIGVGPSLPSTSVLLDPGTEPAGVGAEFGGTEYFDASRPLASQGAAEKWAESVSTDLAGALSEMEAECEGNPALVAGAVVSLGMSGPPFEGNFICTSAHHVFDPADQGYVTWVTVGGYRDRSTLALASGQGPADKPRPTMNGVVVGTVVETEDPLDLGRVKLLFPWLDPDYVSDWARIVQIGASKAGTGFQWFPNIGDEVLVAFDRGYIDYPYVIGNVYNGENLPIPAPEWAPVLQSRRIISGLGHSITFNDGEEATGIVIGTTPVEDPPLSITLDDEAGMLTINVEEGQITISAAGPITISSEATVTISAPEITIGDEDTAALTLSADVVTLGSQAEAITIGGGETATVVVGGDLISLGGG